MQKVKTESKFQKGDVVETAGYLNNGRGECFPGGGDTKRGTVINGAYGGVKGLVHLDIDGESAWARDGQITLVQSAASVKREFTVETFRVLDNPAYVSAVVKGPRLADGEMSAESFKLHALKPGQIIVDTGKLRVALVDAAYKGALRGTIECQRIADEQMAKVEA